MKNITLSLSSLLGGQYVKALTQAVACFGGACGEREVEVAAFPEDFAEKLDSIDAIIASDKPHVLNRVINLETGSLAPLLSKSRWCFLKRKQNLTDKQALKLKELLRMNLRTIKAYLLKEQFHKFWDYKSPGWAGKFLDQWRHAENRSRIEPMKEVAKMLHAHQHLILNYFRAKRQFNSGVVEVLNLKVNLTVRKAFGFRSFEIAKTALYHQLGDLPEPQFAHEFW